MKLNNLTIILILLILFYYPDVVNKLTETILGKLIMITIITIVIVFKEGTKRANVVLSWALN